VKALTVRQPWAWAIIHGGKDVENRSRGTSHRGQIYIHAGLGYSTEAEEHQAMQEAWINAAQKLPAERGNMGPLRKQDLFLDYGQVIGTVDVVGCHHATECWCHDCGDHCSAWAQPDVWHWELANPRPLACPFPEKGKLGIWNLLPQEVMV
jgi:hypothetical protein